MKDAYQKKEHNKLESKSVKNSNELTQEDLFNIVGGKTMSPNEEIENMKLVNTIVKKHNI